MTFKPGDFMLVAWLLQRPCRCTVGCTGIERPLFLLWQRDAEFRLTMIRGIVTTERVFPIAASRAAAEATVLGEVEEAERKYTAAGGSSEAQKRVRVDIYSGDPEVVGRKLQLVGDHAFARDAGGDRQ